MGSIPGSERSPGGWHGNLCSILAWRIPWTEEPDSPMGHKEWEPAEPLSTSAGHEWVIHWIRGMLSWVSSPLWLCMSYSPQGPHHPSLQADGVSISFICLTFFFFFSMMSVTRTPLKAKSQEGKNQDETQISASLLQHLIFLHRSYFFRVLF